MQSDLNHPIAPPIASSNKANGTKKTSFKKASLILAFLGVTLLLAAIASLFVDPFPISLRQVLTGEEVAIATMIHYRIPRTLAVIISGIGMSICGLIMQAITNNKFVSPMTAGTLDGARLGYLLAILIVPAAGALVKSVFAFFITLGTTLFFIFLLSKIKIKNATFVPLIGIIYGGVIAAITTLIALQHNAVQLITVMLVGSFAVTLGGLDVWLPIILASVFVVVSYVFSNWFMVAGLGSDTSKNLGLNYKLTVNIGLIIVAIITASVLILAGIIPFLGLVVPNIVSLYMGDNIKRTLPVTALLGGVFLLICDILARVVMWPFEVPVGLIMGVVGAALFLVLLLIKRRREKNAT